MIKVVVVDDSAFMRKSISIMLESDPEIKVVASARDGVEGVEFVKKYKPDLVTMDIEMPRMDGLAALQQIMKECPVPVLMLSSLTTEGADATIKALEYGAVDFIPKELSYVNVNIIQIKAELIRKIKEITRYSSLRERLKRIQGYTSRVKANDNNTLSTEIKTDSELPKLPYKAVAIGISTGGPLSLQKVLPFINPKIGSPIFIVQHMPPKFTKSLSERLNSMSQIQVKEAENGERVNNGVVYIAPGGFHMTIVKSGAFTFEISISEQPDKTLHRPSVDVMMDSVINVYGKNMLGVMMTGMGKDGFESIKRLKALGGACLAQDEQSCVVYGMPKSVVDAGFANVVAPLENIAGIINKAF